MEADQPRRRRQAGEPATKIAQLPEHLTQFLVQQADLLVQLFGFLDQVGLEKSPLLELRALGSRAGERLFNRRPSRHRPSAEFGTPATNRSDPFDVAHHNTQPFDIFSNPYRIKRSPAMNVNSQAIFLVFTLHATADTLESLDFLEKPCNPLSIAPVNKCDLARLRIANRTVTRSTQNNRLFYVGGD